MILKLYYRKIGERKRDRKLKRERRDRGVRAGHDHVERGEKNVERGETAEQETRESLGKRKGKES